MDEIEARYWRERLARYIRNTVADGGASGGAAGGDQGERGVTRDLIGGDVVQSRSDLEQNEKSDSGGNPDIPDKATDRV